MWHGCIAMENDKEDKRFIESPNFPIDIINEASAKEKMGGGRPPHWEMVFWWTRKPLAGARAVIAGALLPYDTNPEDFIRNLRLKDGVAHRKNPIVPKEWREIFSKARLLDPFAGFGSIPLEAMRLGVGEVVAVELLPTAYVFLKAVLEYPKWAVENGLADKLIRDIKYWGEWIIERLREDPDIRELYEDDVAVYIGTWEVRCPHCGRWTPIVGNWWLARVSKNVDEEDVDGARSGYSRLAWMEPVKKGDRIEIRVVDLNMELRQKVIKARVNPGQGIVEVGGKKYRVPIKNIEARRETATCLHCNNQIRRGEKDWYIKEALRDWNQRIEDYLTGQIELETLLNESKARPRLLVLVKQSEGDLEFQPATQENQQKLWKALQKLRQIWGDPDIPTEEIPPYQFEPPASFPILHYNFNLWFKIYNARQLLTYLEILKSIRLIKTKIYTNRDIYDRAIVVYLSISLAKLINYNSIVNRWDPSWIKIGETLSTRGININWNWCDVNPLSNFIGSWGKCLQSVLSGLRYLTIIYSRIDRLPTTKIQLADSADLAKLDSINFNIVVTDPPYRDDIAYTELSDIYYIWLRRALSEVHNLNGLIIYKPKYLREAFFMNDTILDVQWKYFASKEISENQQRLKFLGFEIDGLDHFKTLLSKSFMEIALRLHKGGLLVTYYAHSSPEAWEALLDAGWRGASLRISAAHAFVTESKHRVNSRGKAGLDVSIVAVWRKGVSGRVLAGEAYAEALDKCTDYAKELLDKGFEGVNLFVSVLGQVLSVFTKYEEIVGVRDTRELVERYVYPATAEVIARAIGGEDVSGRLMGESLFYVLAKVLISRRPRQARRVLDRSTMTILAIGTRNEIGELKSRGVVKQNREKFILLEPDWNVRDTARSVKSVLEERGIKPSNPSLRSGLDMLHILEYYASTLPESELRRRAEELKMEYPRYYDEAMVLIRVLHRVLGSDDPEKRPIDILAKTLLGLQPIGPLDRFGVRGEA